MKETVGQTADRQTDRPTDENKINLRDTCRLDSGWLKCHRGLNATVAIN